MDIDPCETIPMELKYCERCGGLWLRQRGSSLSYCSPCAHHLAEFPLPPKKLPRSARNRRSEIHSRAAPSSVCRDAGTA